MRLALAGLAAALLLAAVTLLPPAGTDAQDDGPRRRADFDFYVLSLSWSPTYCAHAEGDRQQCDTPRGFVVHGLWPQNERGWPEYCTERQPIPRRLVDTMLDIMPSRRLVYAQWDKHGTCTGLSAEDYFQITRRASQAVRIPSELRSAGGEQVFSAEALETAFVQANPGLEPGMIAIDCKGELLEEVRVCLDKRLGYTACDEVDRKACRRQRIVLPGAG